MRILTSNGLANEWVGWVTKAPALLCLELATVGSHGGRFGIGVSVLPDGEMPEEELRLLSQVAQFEEIHADLFGPQTAISDAQMIVEPFVPDGEFSTRASRTGREAPSRWSSSCPGTP